MLTLRNVRRSLARNPGRSLLMAIIAFFLVCFAILYVGNITRGRAMLNTLGQKIPVEIALTNADGSREIGLAISRSQLEDFRALGVANLVVTAESYGNVDTSDMLEDWSKVSTYIMGANSMAAFSIAPESLSVETAFADDFLAGAEGLCLVNRAFIENRGLTIETGGTLDVNLYQGKYDAFDFLTGYEEIAPARLTVAGFYASELPGGPGMGADTPDIICPMDWLSRQYEEAGKLLTYTSATGRVQSPLALNGMKQAAEELGFKQTNLEAGASRRGIALAVNDRLFIQSASGVMRSLRMFGVFTVPMMLVIVLLEFLAVFLSARSRKQEWYIARCLGRRQSALRLEMILEGLALSLVGGLAGALTLAVLGFAVLPMGLLVAAVFLCVTAAGSLFVTYTLGRTSLMQLGSRAE